MHCSTYSEYTCQLTLQTNEKFKYFIVRDMRERSSYVVYFIFFFGQCKESTKLYEFCRRGGKSSPLLALALADLRFKLNNSFLGYFHLVFQVNNFCLNLLPRLLHSSKVLGSFLIKVRIVLVSLQGQWSGGRQQCVHILRWILRDGNS